MCPYILSSGVPTGTSHSYDLNSTEEVLTCFPVTFQFVFILFKSLRSVLNSCLSLKRNESNNWMTGPKWNSEFCFTETLNVPRGETDRNI